MILCVTFSDDWQQAAAGISNILHSVPLSVPLSVIRVFVVVSDQLHDESVLSEVQSALSINVLHLTVAILVKVFKVLCALRSWM